MLYIHLKINPYHNPKACIEICIFQIKKVFREGELATDSLSSRERLSWYSNPVLCDCKASALSIGPCWLSWPLLSLPSMRGLNHTWSSPSAPTKEGSRAAKGKLSNKFIENGGTKRVGKYRL